MGLVQVPFILDLSSFFMFLTILENHTVVYVNQTEILWYD